MKKIMQRGQVRYLLIIVLYRYRFVAADSR